MHGFCSGPTFLVNAGFDSMGVVVDSGVGAGTKLSPCRAAIEKAQAELRLEYDVREERRRELEFLEKGGDPLDFKFSHAASVSAQSTSHTDQHPYPKLSSEAKGSFPLIASAHGDSVESSGRLRASDACEPNSADNFDGENEILRSDKKSMHPGRSIIPLSGNSSQDDGIRNTKDPEDSSYPKKRQAYRRRNRSRTNRDGPRSSSADMTSHGGNGSSMRASENQFEMESDGTHMMHSTMSRVPDFAEGKPNSSNSKENLEEAQNLSSRGDQAPDTTVEPGNLVGRDNVDTLDVECPPFSGAEKTEDNATFTQLNVTTKVNGNNNVPVTMKGLDSESSCTQTNISVDGNENIDSELCTTVNNVPSDGALKEDTRPAGDNSVSRDDKMPSEGHAPSVVETACCVKEDRSSISNQVDGFMEDPVEVDLGKSSTQDQAKSLSNVEGQEKHNLPIPKMESSCDVTPCPVDPVSNELNKNGFSGPSPVLDSQPCTENQPKLLDKAQEDRILEEARMIEAKRKRIAELSIGLIPKEHRHKCYWDLVLEEMAWLANDFAQERLWKMTAAAQICHRLAFASRTRLEEQSKILKQKSVAHTMAKSVMEFWHSARLCVENTDSSKKCKHEPLSGAYKMDEASQDGLQATKMKQRRALSEYAVGFLQFNCSLKAVVEVEVAGITDVAGDTVLPEVSWQDQFTEENLFYAVPPGAMEMYRNSVESCLVECERKGNNVQEEFVTPAYDAAAECGYEENAYEEDEGENLYYEPGKPSKKKRKNMKSRAARLYEFGGDSGYGHCGETGNGTTQLNVLGKRPVNNIDVDVIPTKRVRTERQRVVGSFGAAPAGVAQVQSRADGSSEDTNSFQDDHSFLHGGSVVARGSEVDSMMNFKKQSTFEHVDMPAKHKKKKKIKHQNLSYDQRWQLEPSMQDEQKDFKRKRVENYQFESNGNGGVFGQHAKKPKLAKHSLDNSFDNTVPMSGSVASPVASQMSNFSSQTKIIKFIGRDRGKKGKGLKVSVGQLGSGSPWTIVEDQALVVLVHDMGPNWELVSDAINSILQFKCIFRKPRECKERHRFLMDRPSGDGADSADDSGSSQPYPSTLPGIPKGSARQLFRSLHAHVEEDNIKSRFEKIINIEQQLHIRKKKNYNHDLKQIVPAHSSHILSLSQVIPNNMNGIVLTPLDLCDIVTSNQDPLLIENKSSHACGLPLLNQSSSIHPPGGLNSSVQGLPGSSVMGIGNNLASAPSQFTSARNARYSVPRSGSLPIEEHQRTHQYNSMLPGRNIQASNLAAAGSIPGSDKGVRMLPGGNGANMTGVNRSIPMARPGAQGIPSSMQNSGSMLSSNMGGLPSNSNVHSGTTSGHGNTVFRPHDSLNGVRSGQISEHQRQMMMPEMQIQATQTNSPGFCNSQTTCPLQTYPGQHHHPHVLNSPHPHMSTSNHGPHPEQQPYIHTSREQQMKQRLSQQRQRQNQHHHPQHPVSSSQLSVSSPSQPVPLSSPTPPSPIAHVASATPQQQNSVQGVGRSTQCAPGGMINQRAKQRQGPAQQHQQLGRQHPQQRQQPQSQPAPKIVKGILRGDMPIHQNLPISPSHSNGLNSANSATSKPVQQISSRLDGGNQGQGQGQGLGSNQGSLQTVVLSRNHQHLQRQPSIKVVKQSQPALQRTIQQNRQANSDNLAKSKVGHSLKELKSFNGGSPLVRVDSASNVVIVQDSVGDSAMSCEPSSSGPSTSPAVANSLGNGTLLPANKVLVVEKQSSGNILVSHGLEERTKQEPQLQAPPLQPILPQKQSMVKGGQSVVYTETTNSRLD